ncbi:MAG TPA: CPBP family glutamic-type intramembrane protease [Tepidisphaeraceae bacterium]|nr:CPBP family glutamic-type intramembrane protease [Tepidisphaeraceae bacterium]
MTRAVENAPIASARGSHAGYVHESELPLTSLVFLLPLIVIYEIGTLYFTTAAHHGYEQQIIAFTMMQRFFRLFGVHGQHLPALAVCAILLSWHIARRDRWQVNLGTLVGMPAESVLWALPLIAVSREIARYVPLATLRASRQDIVIMSLGAGVYEELVFRLVLFTLLSLLFRDVIRARGWGVNLGIVFTSALAFSCYHYLSPLEQFQWRSFTFRTIAGAYFGVLFLFRGFGITAAAHASYDILILFL